MIFPKIESFPTYWENGMKLSASHFRHLEDSIEDSVRDARAASLMTLSGFGLIPRSQFNIQNAQGESPNSVRVILNACQAFMPGGYRVEILPDNIQGLKIPSQAPYVEFVPSPNTRYHIYLTINEQKRIPAGHPEARPIRYPHLVHDYKLECVSNKSKIQTLAANRMKIAQWIDGKVEEGYIPPSMTVSGYELLNKWYQFLMGQLENMVRIALQVINEHRNRDKSRAAFCIPIVNYIRSTQSYYKWQLPNQSPAMLAVYFGNLAGLIEGLIETMDRDFVRNQLKNGEINNLFQNTQTLLKIEVLPLEEMAIVIGRIKGFCDSLFQTLLGLGTNQGPNLRSGERNISSG